MRYLLDTNVVSEQVRPRPDPVVSAWIGGVEPTDLGVSAVTVGEIQKGVLKLGPGARRSLLSRWLEEFPEQFGSRVLPVNVAIARAWGGISHDATRMGRRIEVPDALLIATAVVHRLIVVTRNVRDFSERGVRVIDPWNR